VQLGQCYFTPQSAAVGDYEAMMEW